MHYRFLRFPGGKAKAVTFSYGDGCRHDIPLAKTLTEYGILSTFNINSGLFGKDDQDWHLTEAEIREHIVDAGFEIAVHKKMHMAPGLSHSVDCIQDMLNCCLEGDMFVVCLLPSVIPAIFRQCLSKMELAQSFVNAKASEDMLFYIWGHSYELVTEDDWNAFDEFCGFIAGRDDICYCTNIEVLES